VLALKPEQLPEAPWALKTSKDQKILRGKFFGGDYATVTNNADFLKGLQTDVRRCVAHPGYRRFVEKALVADAMCVFQTLREGKRNE
jgi:hypothetical protein